MKKQRHSCQNMINIGFHVSSAGGFCAMAKTAQSAGANTFQYFSRNPRGGSVKPVDMGDIEKFSEIANKNNFAPIVAHAPYTLNLCSKTESIRNFSKNIFIDDLKRTDLIPGTLYNFHPGSHTGQGKSVGIGQIASALNEILKPDQKTVVLLETMAGKGSEIGGKFEEIREIINNVNLKDKIGVCLDTCHIFDAGYDIVDNLEGVLEEFDKIIGIKNLKAVHLNDSKNICASKKDRHEKIGKGNIGIEAFTDIINNSFLKNLPFILETPHESIEGWKEEIALLKSVSK